jgi:hypothetical protein
MVNLSPFLFPKQIIPNTIPNKPDKNQGKKQDIGLNKVQPFMTGIEDTKHIDISVIILLLQV